MSKIQTKWIADDAITADKIHSGVAGDGLIQAGDGSLEVNDDDSTLEISADILQVKDLGITTAKLAATSVTSAKLGVVAGDGITGGNGSDLAVDPDVTGGANLARAISVSSNGVAVKIDNDTIVENGSQQLAVGANSIGANEVDESDSYTWVTGSHDFTGSGGVTVPTPTGDTDAVTKAYADALRQGAKPKDPAEALADSNQTLSGLPSNIDGVTSWSAGDRVLLTNQTTPSENGIWEVQTGSWTRPVDFDTGDSAGGSQIWIHAGTNYGDSQWTCTTDPPNDVVDTDSIAFTQTSGAGQITAGTGLTKSGNTIQVGDGSTGNINGIARTANDISAAVDDSSIEVASNVLQLKDLGVSTAKLAATSITSAKLGAIAGNGLGGGSGSALVVNPDTVGGANLATVVNVISNGVAVRIDSSTIGENGSNQLYVPNGGITETQLNASVAGTGIAGGGGSALALDIHSLTAETSADDNDEVAIYDNSAGALRRMTRANFLLGTGATRVQEMHLVTAGEVTAGYFTLSNTPVSAGNVVVVPVGGPQQVNKQDVGATGATPDFDILSSNQCHINNNGAATGLSGDIEAGDVLMATYTY